MTLLHNLSKYKIVLASGSPRRRELLAGLDIPFELKVLPDIDEDYPASLQREEIPLYLSQLKAEAYREVMDAGTLLITADTIVWLNGRIYGKPTDADDARRILGSLSGREHEVITGVSLTTIDRQRSFHTVSKVKFADLDAEEIDYYTERYRPYDKAGAYGVQEWIGYIGVERIEGSFYNVMGLPVRRLYEELKRF
jgi:septum formation protein